MIEGCAAEPNAVVAQREHEGDESVLLLVGQPERLDLGIGELRWEIAAAVVEVDHLAQRRLASVVEVRAGELHVSQRRRLEIAIAMVDLASVFGNWPHPCVGERISTVTLDRV